MTHTTELERQMIRKIAESDYNDGDPTRDTWLDTVIEDSGLEPRAAGGVITSLQTKGLAVVSSNGNTLALDGRAAMKDAGIRLTPAGLETYRAIRDAR